MNVKNLYVKLTLQDKSKQYAVEGCRTDPDTGHNELLITLFGQKLWVDAHEVTLYKGRGSTFCWKEYKQGTYVELNDSCQVCPVCGWWKCPVCNSCRCNKP